MPTEKKNPAGQGQGFKGGVMDDHGKNMPDHASYVNLDAILQALGGERTKDNEIMVHCCGHDDPNPSLCLTMKDGKLLVKCYAGCEQDAVIEGLKARGLWPEATSGANGNGIPKAWKGKPRTGLWEYRDLNGSLLGYVARFDGEGGKEVVPYFVRNGIGWKAGAAPEPRPLYGLHKLRDHDGPVLICEGEKATDAAQALASGHACLTWPGGSNAVRKADFAPLAGRDVLVWPDADEPGLKAARAVQKALEHIGVASVRILTPPAGVAHGWDAADALTEGWTPERFAQFAQGCVQEPDACLKGIFNGADLMKMQLPEIRWAVEGLLPQGLAILAGGPKLGKSWLIYSVCAAVGMGGLVLGHFPSKLGKALYLALEDSKRRLQDRLRSLCEIEPGIEAGLGNVDFQTSWPRFDDEGGLELLEAYVAKNVEQGLKLVVIDTAAKVAPKAKSKSLNAYENDSIIMGRIKALADKHGICILIVTHLNKLNSSNRDPFDAITGSTGQFGTADTALLLVRTRGADAAKLMSTGRDIDGNTYGLRWLQPGWTCGGIDNGPEASKVTPERQVVLEVFKNADGPLSPAMVAHATGKTSNSITKLIKKLSQEGVVVCVGYGLYSLVDRQSGQSVHDGQSGQSGQSDSACGGVSQPTLPGVTSVPGVNEKMEVDL